MSDEIIFLESNATGNAVLSMQAARDLGYRCHFLSSSLERYSHLSTHPADVADEVSLIDTYDLTKLLRFEPIKPPAAVVCFDDYRAVQAAILGEYLGVKYGPDYRGLVNARLKDRMRWRLRGSRHHVGYSVHSLGDESPPSVGFPCVVKPADGTGSVGVRVCKTAEDLVDTVRYLRKRSEESSVRGYSIDRYLVEEVIDGAEFSAEMAWDECQGGWRLVGISKTYLSERHIELGHLFPYPMDSSDQLYVESELREILGLLELRRTLVHVEFRLSHAGLKVIEVNPRPAGGRILDIALAAGIDLARLHLWSHLGAGLPADTGQGINGRVAAVRFAVPETVGHISEIIFPDVSDPSIVAAGANKVPLQVKSVWDNGARIAWAIAAGDEIERVETSLIDYVSGITLTRR